MLYDLHVHSTLSDGKLTPAEIAEEARRRGIVVGLTDHYMSHNFLMTDALQRAYLNTLNQYGFLRGIEIDIGRRLALPEFFKENLDYIIGSVHHVVRDGADVKFSPYFRSKTYGEPYEYPCELLGDPRLLLDEICDLIVESLATTPIDILGHVTSLPACDLLGGNAAFSTDWSARIVKACVQNGTALELSGLWRTPHPEMIEIGLDEGVIFSMGSDAHLRAGLFDLQYPLEMVEKYHIPAERLLIPGQKPPRMRR